MVIITTLRVKPGQNKPYIGRRKGRKDGKATTPPNAEDVAVANEKASFNLKQEKGTDLQREAGAVLQQETGADLITKNRLQDKQGIGETAGDLKTYGNYINNRRRFNKHAAKVKRYAQSGRFIRKQAEPAADPYKSTFEDEADSPANTKSEKGEEPTTDDGTALGTEGTFGYTDEPAEAKAGGVAPSQGTLSDLSETSSKIIPKTGMPSLKPSADKPTLNDGQESKLIMESQRINSPKHKGKSTGKVNTPMGNSQAKTPAVTQLSMRESTHGLKPPPDNPPYQDEPSRPLQDEGSRWSKVKAERENGGIATKDDKATKPGKLKVRQSKLSTEVPNRMEIKQPTKRKIRKHAKPGYPHYRLVVQPKKPLSCLPTDSSDEPLSTTGEMGSAYDNSFHDDSSAIDSENLKTQQDVNRKKQYAEAHGYGDKQGSNTGQGERYINTEKSLQSIAYQHRLHDKADKLTEIGSKLREQQEEAKSLMPTKTVTHRGRVYDEETGKIAKVKTTDEHTLHQGETRWNNPKFTQRLKNARGVREKSKLIAGKAAKDGALLGMAGAVGGAPGVAGALVAKPTLEYGSKLMVTAAHRQVRKDIQQNGDNEVLKAAHWAEQKGERALGQGISKLNPVAIRRYVKNTPYRRESKLQIKQLKNDRKLGLLRVKQDKASGINHMTGEKSNALSRAWQRRQIRKNYQQAMIAAKGKGGGRTLSAMTRELARGNPKALLSLAAKKVAFVAGKVAAKLTILNPLFWKLMALVLIFLVILGSVQACVAIFSPSLAGVGFVSDEDIEFSTRIYSEWETDMELFVREANILNEFPPPAHIVNQPTVNGEVVYPPYPYIPPPPFYEYRFEIGMIRHDPMELISYLTARHGERFDEDSDNPMTRSELEAILRDVFEAQYGITPGEFESLVHEEVETRFRRERLTITETRFDTNGQPYLHEEVVYEDIYYEFWILTVRVESKSLSDVLRNRMAEDEEMHFDVLNITGNGRQVLGNPFVGSVSEGAEIRTFGMNWIPNISSHYGYRVHPIFDEKRFHWGIDIGAPLGTPLFATHTGVITQVQFSDTGYGNMLRLRGEGSDEIIYYTLYAHLEEILVTEGQEVEQGDLIATVGSTGDSTGPHLHLEVIRPEQEAALNGETITLTAMHLNPLFAVITWTEDESNEAFRPLPGSGGIRQARPPLIPDIPPEAMSDERFLAVFTVGGQLLGSRYVWGAAGPNTFDCSGLIHWIFSNALPDWTHGRTTASGYFNLSTPVTAENARPGDLVFFHSTHSGAFITHVGIMVNENTMLHTGGNPAGVEFVRIDTPFWQRHFYSFGRV